MNKIVAICGIGLTNTTLEKAMELTGEKYDETKIVRISSGTELTPANVDKWNDQGIKLIIVAKAPQDPIAFKVEPIIHDIYLEKAEEFRILPDKNEIRFTKEQHKFAQIRHSKFNYKKR